MVVGENKRTANIMDGIENTGDVRLHDHRLRLKQRFDIVRKLGQGTYGKVQLGINKKTGQEVAIKTIKKCKIESEADLIRIRREVQIMSSVRHPNIVHIYEVFENSEKMILVMEYCSGGELYDYLSQKKVLEEEEARRLFRQIATAVYYCHIHKICHRDLKLENVLLDDTGSAKIADFGLSNVFKETSLLSTFCGSPLYASPEIVKGTPYIGPEVDCWSLGVLLYTLVYGAMPFDGSNFKRLVRQISNGDYYEPKSPSSASPLIRDMLTVEPLKRADIAYICDHPWVNSGCQTSCLEMAEALAAETPVRLDLLLSLAPAAPSNSNSVVVPSEGELGPEESCTDLTSSTSVAVEPSNSAEKRILELVAEGGEDAIKPSPTRTIVSASDNKRKLELAMSASGLQRKKERVASCASIAPQAPLPEETNEVSSDDQYADADTTVQPCLKSSATMTISPAPDHAQVSASINTLVKDSTREIVKDSPKEEAKEKPGIKPRVTVKKKVSPPTTAEEKTALDRQEESKQEESKPISVAAATDKLTSLSLAQQPTANQISGKPKIQKIQIPGGNVGSFKEQFERRASLTTAPEIKRNLSKPVVSKIAKQKAQSEDRELSSKTPDGGTVRLQQIGIEPSLIGEDLNRSGVKKTESEPTHSTTAVDPSVLLQDARRSLQNSMAKLVEEKVGEDSRRRAARDIISSAIRTGKPPMAYGRSSSAGVSSLSSLSPPSTPPASAPVAPNTPRLFRTEAQHRVEDHRNRGVSVERIIPIHVAGEEAAVTSPPPQPKPALATAPAPAPAPAAAPRANQVPLRRLVSSESAGSGSESCGSPGEPIKKSAREFIIPIAVEGKGYVTPRQRSLEPDAQPAARAPRAARPPRRLSSLVSGGESEEEDDTHMHRLRSSRAARAESVSSGEEDEEEEDFHLLTAENLFSTLLHRVRALTQRLNGEEGPGFPQHPHSLFNNLHQSPFFNSPHLPRRHLLREGWGGRELHADFDSMFNKSRQNMPRGSTKKSSKHQTKTQQSTEPIVETGLDLSDLDLSCIQFSEKEMRALSGLTPALSRRLQQQLLAHLPPAAARSLRRTLSLHAAGSPQPRADRCQRSRSATKTSESSDRTQPADRPEISAQADLTNSADASPQSTTTTPETQPQVETSKHEEKSNPVSDTKEIANVVDLQLTSDATSDKTDNSVKDDSIDNPTPQFCTLPRIKRYSTLSRESTPPTSAATDVGYEYTPKVGTLAKELNHSRGSSIRSTPDRPLLSKYLTPDRTLSLDESYSSDSGSILSEPSYIAAYGPPTIGNLGFRRHSMRLTSDQPRKRISRFLRPDFFDTPPDESLYAKHKKEKELETQKILKEIREKKNKSLDFSSVKSPTEPNDVQQLFKDDTTYPRKCLSPISILTGKDRSRSNTPFFPILDNIKETVMDTSKTTSVKCNDETLDTKLKTKFEESQFANRESKLTRPKSYPVKDSYDEINANALSTNSVTKESEFKEKILPRESKLIRPKSYPTSSPSPEKAYVNRNVKKDEIKNNQFKEKVSRDIKNDVEVSFNVSLPRKKSLVHPKAETNKNSEALDSKIVSNQEHNKEITENSLNIKKYEVANIKNLNEKTEKKEDTIAGNGTTLKDNAIRTALNEEEIKKIDVKLKSPNPEPNEKKGTIKKKVIKKVASKSKTDLGNNPDTGDSKNPIEKKKVTKKIKDKSAEENSKSATVTKKKSVLQSIGHKLEKLASSKSASPEKLTENNTSTSNNKKEISGESRTQREQSVPVKVEPPTESNLIKRAVTLTDVAALDNQNITPSKTTVSKVLGLFKKFEPKEKALKTPIEKSQSLDVDTDSTKNIEPIIESVSENVDNDKPKRPTSLLLNGLGRKNKYERTSSDSVTILPSENNNLLSKKESDAKSFKNSLKLDFSRLPRVKKIVPTNPVIEPQTFNIAPVDRETEKKDSEKKDIISDGDIQHVSTDTTNRDRSRSRSAYSNSEMKSEQNAEIKDKIPLSPSEAVSPQQPLRHHEPTTPEKEDIVDRIRRKSFYSRFNEKKQRRKSSLVGPGATEYDPVARLHSQPTETKYDVSPTSPGTYDLSPGYSMTSDLSPSTERYRSLLTDLPTTTRSNLRFDNYGINDKIDTYRSLDRNDFRKYPSSRSYLDYDKPSTYTTNRYSRTKSLLDSSDNVDDHSLGTKDSHKYNRTLSMYSPGNYATYRPKRTRNPAIILKESEKEPSPENILDKIRLRKKMSVHMSRKSDHEKESLPRSDVPPEGESNSAERSEKVD